MGAVFYLGTGWPQWKPLGIPGTHLPLKRGSWLTIVFPVHSVIYGPIKLSLYIKGVAGLLGQVDFLAEQVIREGGRS